MSCSGTVPSAVLLLLNPVNPVWVKFICTSTVRVIRHTQCTLHSPVYTRTHTHTHTHTHIYTHIITWNVVLLLGCHEKERETKPCQSKGLKASKEQTATYTHTHIHTHTHTLLEEVWQYKNLTFLNMKEGVKRSVSMFCCLWKRCVGLCAAFQAWQWTKAAWSSLCGDQRACHGFTGQGLASHTGMVRVKKMAGSFHLQASSYSR